MFMAWRTRMQLIRRLQHILQVLAKYGFYHVIKRLALHRRLPLLERIRYANQHSLTDSRTASRLREAFETLGPTFVEFGQLLSARPDLLPEEYIRELSLLLSHSRPEKWQSVKQVLQEELLDHKKYFHTIKEQALATGSIAQIHQAVLHDKETKTVLKIQRPAINSLIASDLVVLRMLAQLADKYITESRSLNLPEMVCEFDRSINLELDFNLEAANMEHFSQLFADNPCINVPIIYWDYSTTRVLCMSYIEGIPINDLDSLEKAGLDLTKIASRLLHSFLEQIFRFGFFHADPHGGNFLVQHDGSICFVDFGLVGQLNKSSQRNLARLFEAILAEDFENIASQWLQMCNADGDINQTSFQKGMEPIIRSQINQPLHRTRLGEMMLQMVQNSSRLGLRMPSELYLLFRTFAQIEDLLRRLHPQLNIIEHCKSYAEEQRKAGREPLHMARAAGEELQQWVSTARQLPGNVEQLIRKMNDDQFSIDFVHRGLEYLVGELDRSSNRIAIGLIIAALIIGSSLIVLSGAGPKLFGLPAFGLVGFTAAFILGFFLVLLVLRSGKY